MSTVGNVNIRITADNSNAEKGIKQTKSSMSSLGKSVGDNAKKWAKWGAAAAAAAVGVAAAITRHQMGLLDNLGKTSDALGIQQERLQALQHVAELTGAGADQLSTNLERMQRNLGKVAREGGPAEKALAEIGVNAKDILALPADRQLEAIAQSMGNVENAAVKASIAQDLFGRDGVRMLKMMEQLKEDGLDPVVAELDNLGVALNRVDTAKVEAANDALTKSTAVMSGLFQKAAVEVAPIVQAIAERFNDAARESGGFGNVVGNVFDFLIEAIAKAASAIDGIIRAIKTIGNAFDFVVSGVTAAFAGLMRLVMRAIDNIVNGVISGVNALIRQLNRIPRVDISELADSDLAAQAAQFFDNVGGAAVERMEDAWDRTQEVWSQPYAGDTVRSFVAESREMAETAAREAVEARNQVFDEAGPPPSFMFTEEENQKFLEQLRQRFASEDQLFEEKLAADLARLQEARAQELLTEQQYQEKLTSLTREAADRRSQIAENERQARIGILQSMLGNMTSLMNTGSRKMFEIGKAAAVANALVQGREAIVSSYAAGARIGGPPVGAAFAATAAAATASQIAQVRSSSFSSGGAASAGTFDQGLGAIRTAQAGPQQPQQVAQISISGGDFFSRDTVMGLMNQIQQLSQDGVRFQIAGGG